MLLKLTQIFAPTSYEMNSKPLTNHPHLSQIREILGTSYEVKNGIILSETRLDHTIFSCYMLVDLLRYAPICEIHGIAPYDIQGVYISRADKGLGYEHVRKKNFFYIVWLKKKKKKNFYLVCRIIWRLGEKKNLCNNAVQFNLYSTPSKEPTREVFFFFLINGISVQTFRSSEYGTRESSES